MSLQLVLCLVVLFGLAAIGTPIAYSIILAAIVYLGVAGQDVALAGEKILQGLYNSFILLAVPLFIVAANIMNAGTISDRLLAFCVATVGRFRGGLGHVNVVASLIFAGMSGSAVADAAGIGRIIIDMMRRSGYSAGYAAALTAASATIGPIIPPSIPMVLYALVSNTSIGALFLGGIGPGLFIGFVLMVMNYVIARKRNYGQNETPVPISELPKRTVEAFPALLMPVILLYGIYGGVTTPTEAAALAAFYALLLAGVFYRALTFKSLYTVFAESARSSASVGLVIGGALILNYVVASENIPNSLAGLLSSMDTSPLIFMFGVNLLFLLLGCILDATTIILVIMPLFIPTASALGIDLVYFGVVAVVNCMIGLITPPYGIVPFVINAVTGIRLREIISEIWAFLGVLVAALIVMILVPDIVLFLPRMFGYQG